MNGAGQRRDFRNGNAGELENTGGIEVARQARVPEHPLPNAAIASRIRTCDRGRALDGRGYPVRPGDVR